MAILTIRKGKTTLSVPFDGTPKLSELTEKAGLNAGFSLSHPCGGRGVCGKCAVEVEGALSPLTESEERAGHRLSCQTRLLGDATLTLPDEQKQMVIETGFETLNVAFSPMSGTVGAAVDIGTTTVVLRLYDLKTGAFLADASAINPQTVIAADVMGRIGAAKEGKGELLSSLIRDCIRSLRTEAAKKASLSPDAVDRYILTGNTTMLYLLTGHDPDCLSHAPFTADTLFGEEWALDGIPAYLPLCMSAFVGADITTAVLASGMTAKEETALLCDIGTNGEIALWRSGKLYVSSTAAGPAFEGAGISCGCGGIPGAIDRVSVKDGELSVHVIGERTPTGLCGSGLIDAVACYLDTEIIDETGSIDGDTTLAEGIAPDQKDIRAVQLAKAAIAAGIKTLLEVSGTKEADIGTLYIAGGFGSHLNIGSAVRIGLIPEALGKVARPIGNAALAGAVKLMLSTDSGETVRAFAENAEAVNLGGNIAFNENYMEGMLFPFED